MQRNGIYNELTLPMIQLKIKQISHCKNTSLQLWVCSEYVVVFYIITCSPRYNDTFYINIAMISVDLNEITTGREYYHG